MIERASGKGNGHFSEEEFIESHRHRFDREYLDAKANVMRGVLKRFVKNSVVLDNGVFDRLREYGMPVIHLSNHLSHYDYLQQLYNIWAAGMEFPRIVARENVFAGPLKEIWEKCGAFKIPFGKMNQSQMRAFYHMVRDMVAERNSFLIYPEGGRSYGGEIKTFHPGGVELIKKAASEMNVNYMVVPHHISYDPCPIERDFFDALKFAKERSLGLYKAIDAFAFLKMYLSQDSRPNVTHRVGEPFHLNGYVSGREVCRVARSRILELEKLAN